MDIPISSAGPELDELVRRAEAGEDIVLTRNGEPAVRLSPMPPPSRWRDLPPESRRAALDAIVAQAQEKLKSVPAMTMKEIDDEMYDEDGLPK